MGWSCQDKPDNIKEFFTEYFFSGEKADEPKSFEVIDSALKNFRTLFVLLKITSKETGESINMVEVVLISYENNGNTMCYKNISEHAGPYEYSCPKRILDKLTPTSEYPESFGFSESSKECANEWRKGCYNYLANSKKMRNQVYFKTESPLEFTDDTKASYFKKIGIRGWQVNSRSKTRYETPEGIGYYQLTRRAKDLLIPISKEEYEKEVEKNKKDL